MEKGFYYFGECGAFEKFLVIGGLLSIAVSAVFFLLGGLYSSYTLYDAVYNPYSIWCAIFLSIGIILFLIDAAIHKICRDIATLLKEVEDKKRE